MDAVAYSVAPQSMLAPVGTVGLLINLLTAQRVHGDKPTARDVAATALVILGAATCMLHGAPSDDAKEHLEFETAEGFGSDDRRDPAFPDKGAFTNYAAVVALACTLLSATLCALRDVGGSVDALANAALGGLLGSTTVVASKHIAHALSDPLAGVISIATACVPIAAIAPVHLLVLNRGFGRHPLVFMSPVGGAAGLLANVATGCYLYSEVPENPALFAYGVALLCSGVLLLCSRGAGDSKASHSKANKQVD